MLGKYNFNKQDVEKVMLFFEPTIHTITTLFDEIKKDLQIANLNNTTFVKIYKYLQEMTYFDSFMELKDKFIYFYEEIWNFLILENNNQLIDKQVVLTNVIQAMEMILNLDYWITKSYDNVGKKQNILNTNEVKEIIFQKIWLYHEELIIIEEDYFEIFNNQVKELLVFLKNNKNPKTWEQSCEIILAILNESTFFNTQLNNFFGNLSNVYWKVFTILNKIFILAGFLIFLDY